MFNSKAFRRAVQMIDLGGRFLDLIDAAPLEIRVVKRRVHKTAARSQSTDHFVEIERNLGERILAEFWHVAITRPAFDVASHVILERIKSATGDDHLDPFVKNGSEKGIVST